VEKIYKCIIIALLFLVLVFGGSTIFYARKSNESGRLCNQLRERIIDAENTNRGLAETIERSQSICGELGDSVDRNIRTAREAVELIEEIRVQVQSLEMVTGDFNPDDYYNYWDSVYGIE
jgi:hypothetical protein